MFAAGDVTGRMPFTHVAGAHGGVVVTNALFNLRRRVNEDHIPWTVYTDPEVAHVGLAEADARDRWGNRTGARLRDVGLAVHAYPTFTEAPWRAALEHLRGRYLSARVRRVARPVLWLLRHLDVPR